MRRMSTCLPFCVPSGEAAGGAIRDRTIAAIGDPRALPKLLVHAIRQYLGSHLHLGSHLPWQLPFSFCSICSGVLRPLQGHTTRAPVWRPRSRRGVARWRCGSSRRLGASRRGLASRLCLVLPPNRGRPIAQWFRLLCRRHRASLPRIATVLAVRPRPPSAVQCDSSADGQWGSWHG